MDYTFNENDLNTLGITDNTQRSLLLKTTIVGKYTPFKGCYYLAYTPELLENGGFEFKWSDTKYGQVANVNPSVNSVMEISNGYLSFEANSGYVNYIICEGSSRTIQNNKSSYYFTTYANLEYIKVLGKCDLFGIIYDGDKTLTYNGNTVTISVYDDTGLTVLGQSGVKRIIYNGNNVKVLNLNGINHDLVTDINVGLHTFPKPPTFNNPYSPDGRDHFIVIVNILTDELTLVEVHEGFGIYQNKIYYLSDTSLSSGTTTSRFNCANLNYWKFSESTAGTISLLDYEIIASTDNVYEYTSTNVNSKTNIYFEQNLD